MKIGCGCSPTSVLLGAVSPFKSLTLGAVFRVLHCCREHAIPPCCPCGVPRPSAGRSALLIIWAHQRSLDVQPERLRHVGDSASDPAKPGNRGDRQQHVGDLILGRAREADHISPSGDIAERSTLCRCDAQHPISAPAPPGASRPCSGGCRLALWWQAREEPPYRGRPTGAAVCRSVSSGPDGADSRTACRSACLA